MTPNNAISEMLRKSGFSTGEKTTPKVQAAPKKEDIPDQLVNSGLSVGFLLESLMDVISGSNTSESAKLKAIEHCLKMHGALRNDSSVAQSSVNIIINDPGAQSRPDNFTNLKGVNPILMPRELLLEVSNA